VPQLPQWLQDYPQAERDALLRALNEGVEAAHEASLCATANGPIDPHWPDGALSTALDRAIRELSRAWKQLHDMVVHDRPSRALWFTRRLRHDHAAFYTRIRTLVDEQGFDPHNVALAELFPDGEDYYWGLLVSRDRVAEFGFSYLGRSIEQGTFTRWEDATSRYDTDERVACARAILAAESPQSQN
jgi:hypothetical protein